MPAAFCGVEVHDIEICSGQKSSSSLMIIETAHLFSDQLISVCGLNQGINKETKMGMMQIWSCSFRLITSSAGREVHLTVGTDLYAFYIAVYCAIPFECSCCCMMT